jgi:ATP-dependent DNA helicase RecQ
VEQPIVRSGKNGTPVELSNTGARAIIEAVAVRQHLMSRLDVCRRTARRTFGIERLRPEQESAMVAVLEGHDVLVALHTGFGKSLIYQVPAMMVERPTIVVSPLIALMADQARALKSRGVPVVVLTTPETLVRRRSAEVCFSAGTSGKSTGRAAAPATAAAPAVPRLRVPARRGRAILENEAH